MTVFLPFLFVQNYLGRGRPRILEMKKASKAHRNFLIPNPSAKLFDQLREVMRFDHYSYRTEKTYAQWIHRYLTFHRQKDRSGPSRGWRHPREMGAAQVAAFLTHLASRRDVAAATQKQAFGLVEG